MNRFLGISIGPSLLLSLTIALPLRAEISFQAVAVTGQPAPGFGGNATFSGFSCFSLADDGRLAFTAQAIGTGITITNSQGIWSGLPGTVNLIARAGAPAPGAGPGVTFYYFPGINMDNCQYLGFIADLRGPGIDPNAAGSLWVAAANPLQVAEPLHLVVPDPNGVSGTVIRAKSYSSGCNGELLVACVTNRLACGVDLSGSTIDFSNNEAILVGSYTNWTLSPRSGSPAPGTTGNFLGLITETKALAPDGQLAFTSYAEGVSGVGVWMGAPGAFKAVALPGGPAPASLCGAGCTYTFVGGLEVEVNGRGEIAFEALLTGPGLNSTNSDFVVAGTPGALRAVAQSGQTAPGIPGGAFRSFGNLVIGSDGSVAFVASYTETGFDLGLWLAPASGTPVLLARNGAQAPGAPSGVVFATSPFTLVPPVDEFYMNARGQIAFRAELSGPGVGSTNSVGIWLAEPDGTVNLVVRAGDIINVGGASRQLVNVTFGTVGVPVVAGPEDGRVSPFNDRSEVLFWASWQNPAGPPDFGSFGQGIFIAGSGGLILTAEKVGNDIVVKFPTIAGKHYRVDCADSLPSSLWLVLVMSVVGTGAEVTVTDAGVVSLLKQRFYRVVQLD
jgi:hypothetical protein